MRTKKTKAVSKSRLAPKQVEGGRTHSNNPGILNYFDVQKVTKPVAESAVANTGEAPKRSNTRSKVQEHDLPQHKCHQKENVVEQGHRGAPKVVGKVVRDSGQDTKGRQSKINRVESMIMVEEYGQCSSQDIILGNMDNIDSIGGKVVWTASPGEGFLSTELDRKRLSLESISPSPRSDRSRRIEPVILPDVSEEGDVFDALSTALKYTVPNERRSSLLSTPRTDIKGTLGALKQCCDDLESNPSPTPVVGLKNKRRRSRSSMKVCETSPRPGRILHSYSKEINSTTTKLEEGPTIKIKVEDGEAAKPNAAKVCWGEESDEDDEALLQLMESIDKKTQPEAIHIATDGVSQEKQVPAHLACRWSVLSCGSDAQGPVLTLHRYDGRRIFVHLYSPWSNCDYRPVIQ
jgi:hypothetical protein